jgi:hypothetical protein
VLSQEIETVPLNGRSFLDVACSCPAWRRPNVGGNQLFAETSAVPGAGLSVASQRNFSKQLRRGRLVGDDDERRRPEQAFPVVWTRWSSCRS